MLEMVCIYAQRLFLRVHLGQSILASQQGERHTINEEADMRQPNGSQSDGYNGSPLPYGDSAITYGQKLVVDKETGCPRKRHHARPKQDE